MGVHGGNLQELDILVFTIGGMEDHVHSLFRLPPTISLARAVSVIKANSSRWMSELGVKFSWQKGYGAFSVSSSHIPMVAKYVDNQEIHHRKRTFEQEFVALLEKHGVQYDPDFIFA